LQMGICGDPVQGREMVLPLILDHIMPPTQD
jgi:hypothetical protein